MTALTTNVSNLRQRLVGIVRSIFRSGVRARLKLARLSIERKLYRRRVGPAEFADALRALGDWKGRVVWVQSSWNDLYNLDMRPREVIDLMLDLVGPEGTLVMPAFPLRSDPDAIIAIDTAPVSTGLLCEMFRRMPGARRSVHISASVAALGPDAEYLTQSHHLDHYPWGPDTPYGRIYEKNGLMVGLAVTPLGLTPLHQVECALHHRVERFRSVFANELTYRWKRRNGDTGTHTTLVRQGTIRPDRLVRHLPNGLYRQIRLSNFQVQSAPARETVDALKTLALKNKTIYVK